ncbi:MAG: hypothetical protein HKN67_07335 [Saprospiraceae bacterium]|nr:hypothetical protein [Bacteroidia bacterium]MBT8229593.1 hypothetical protein [Bacteroidia bacterium]NNF21738.1 hypothetical protein [Saprospiraceae bacterium]NNK90165.1 hypothetical protein [Saprospiraceae bacterium]
MKKILYSCFIMLALLSSCSKDPCEDVNCVNGDCIEGTCNCLQGYEGLLCDTEVRAKYFGIYEGDISPCIPNQGPSPIDLEMIGDFTASTIIVGPGSDVNHVNMAISTALVNINENINISSSSFTIPQTNLEINDPDLIPFAITISTSGLGEFIDENTINATLQVSFTLTQLPIPITQTCEIIFTKQ